MVESQEDEVFTIGDEPISLPSDTGLPDDFFSPFWRDNGAASIISKSLHEIKGILTKMIDEGFIVQKKLQRFYDKYPSFKELQAFYVKYPYDIDGFLLSREGEAEYEEYMGEYEEFWEITSDFAQLEHDLACCANTAILMAAIDVEACVNRFCYYNLGEVTTEAIEWLPPTGKLAVIHKVLGLGDFKGTSQYQAVKALTDWRNAFAHGKCPGMPIRSLKDNHLKEPKNVPSSRDRVNEVIILLKHYIVVCSHLNEISTHPYTKGDYGSDLHNVKLLLKDVQAFWFKDEFTVEMKP